MACVVAWVQKKGERLCYCKKAVTLKTNMVEVVAQFDEELAKKFG